jgi:hypothetical protein
MLNIVGLLPDKWQSTAEPSTKHEQQERYQRAMIEGYRS